jgi:hypothetical protein
MNKRVYKVITAMVFVFSSCTKAIIDENPVDPKPLTDTIKYNPEVQGLMYDNCVTCHAGAAPSAGLRLDNYKDTKYATENGNLIQRMNSTTSPMPPSGILSADKRQIMDKWITDGFLEN